MGENPTYIIYVLQSSFCQYVGEIEWVTESVTVATLGEACHIL